MSFKPCCRVINLSRCLPIKTSLENQMTCSVKCTEKFVFGFQDDLSFSRRPVIFKASPENQKTYSVNCTGKLQKVLRVLINHLLYPAPGCRPSTHQKGCWVPDAWTSPQVPALVPSSPSTTAFYRQFLHFRTYLYWRLWPGVVGGGRYHMERNSGIQTIRSPITYSIRP